MRRVALILAAVVPLTLAGCGDSTGPGRLTGTYTLRSIGGDPLPAAVSFAEEVTASSLTLNGDATFSASITSRFIASGATNTLVFGGTYTRSGNDIQLTYPDVDGTGTVVANATWDGNRTVTVEDQPPWVYVR
jgi:hypothetical protein